MSPCVKSLYRFDSYLDYADSNFLADSETVFLSNECLLPVSPPNDRSSLSEQIAATRVLSDSRDPPSVKAEQRYARLKLLSRLGQQLANSTDAADITLRGAAPCCSKKSPGKTHRRPLLGRVLASFRRGTPSSRSQGSTSCCGRTVVVHLTPDELSVLECAEDDFDPDVDSSGTDLEATVVGEDEDAGDIGTLPI